MADLVYFSGPMDCGKSTLALQLDYTHTDSGRVGRRFTCQDRSGTPMITTRIGLDRPAIEVIPEFDFWSYTVGELTQARRVDYLICDEAQFYRAEQVDQIARVVDELQIDAFCFGILTDFRTEMFPGSKRLVELCDRMEPLQVAPLCWCGERATHNARTVDGTMVTTGSQIVVGDTASADEPGRVGYEVLCRRHHRRKIPRAVARATLTPEPLPFGDMERATGPQHP